MKNEKQGARLLWGDRKPGGTVKRLGGRGDGRTGSGPVRKRTSKLVAGLMSGTSLDGIDAVLLRVWGEGTTIRFEQLAYLERPFPPIVRSMLLRNSHPESSRIDELTRLNMVLAHLYADAVRAVARKAGVPIRRIDLIGSHGQTVHHLPRPVRIAGKKISATLQIGDPSALATLTGIPTVGNFRIADMAVGGQGAPLVPYFDWLVFSSKHLNRILLNIGGIANITALPAGCDARSVVAFDTGPGNMVVDGLMKHFYGRRFDREGRVASQGTVIPGLLAWMSKHPYLRMHPPKSTGRELFGKAFVESLLRRSRGQTPANIVHTAALLTPLSVYDAYARFVKKRMRLDEIIVSGGGARNRFFLESLRELFGGVRVETAGEAGMNADAKEAICFAVLAHETLAGRPANMPRVTGASRPVVLGCICDPGGRMLTK
ncbi:MAG: anhydro-N-acetylmuramic acid kinase [Bacteroidetes bacterium]|nr:anhydro-N-acetylmuramic acid kinase [Bacteroidota bacterium]